MGEVCRPLLRALHRHSAPVRRLGWGLFVRGSSRRVTLTVGSSAPHATHQRHGICSQRQVAVRIVTKTRPPRAPFVFSCLLYHLCYLMSFIVGMIFSFWNVIIIIILLMPF